MPITATPYTAVYFNPQSVSGCCIWLDAADPVSFNSGGITNGTTITTWNDKSGVGQSITVAGTPVWNSTTLNSSPSVNLTNGRFSGVFTNTLSNFTFTAFIITSLNSYPTGGYPCLAFQNTPSGTFLRVLDYAGAFRYYNFLTGGFGLSTTASLTTPFLWSTTYNGSTSAYLYYNGSNTANSTAASSPGCNAAYFYLGTEPGDIPGVNSWPGYVSEVVVYNSVLTQTARQQVEGYLAQKWGLTSQLPAGHPGLTQTIYTSNYNYKFYQSRIPLSPQPIYQNFKPTQLTGVTCALWMDGADTTTMTTSGTTVTQWRDKSGLGYNTTVIGGAPALTANAINGLSAISFNGSSYMTGCNANTTATASFFLIATLASGQGANQQYTSAYAFSRNVAGAADYNEVQSINGLFCQNAATSLAMSPQRNTFNGPTYTLSNYNTAFMHTTVCNGTTMAGYGNGTSLGTTSSTGNFAITFYNIGSQTSQSPIFYNYYWTGYVGELIAFNNALSDSQRQQIEGYLAWKWGLQSSLPSNHPYLNVPPGVPWESTLTKIVGNIPYIIATGGTVTFAFGREFHTFTSNGTFTITTNTRSRQIDILCVGGGGGGGAFEGGGGGGGGFTLLTTNLALGSYSITLGNGGTAGVPSGAAGGTGGTTTFGVLVTAAGGGGGGSSFGSGPSNGASGGGGAYSQSFGTGSPGGNGAVADASLLWGGGGGASGSATNNNGGPGTAYYGVYYGGGGGGGGNQGSPGTGGIGGGGAGGGSGTPSVQSPLPAPTPGTPNTGGGGGGMGYNSNTGAIGGSGVVIVSFSTS